MKKKMTYLNILILVLYVLFAQTAVLLVKLGASSTTVSLQRGDLSLVLNLKTIAGLCLYVCSFLMWIILLSRNNLSFVTPIITGANYIVPMAIGIILLKEKMSVQQWIGASVILLGLIICNIRGGGQ